MKKKHIHHQIGILDFITILVFLNAVFIMHWIALTERKSRKQSCRFSIEIGMEKNDTIGVI